MSFNLADGVTKEILNAKTMEISADVEKMNAEIQKMIIRIEDSSQYWQGDAAESIRTKMNEQVDLLNEMMERLGTYPEKVQNLAGITEKANAETEEVKTDIVMN